MALINKNGSMNFINWIIEYSVSEKAFHVAELSQTLKRNLKLAIQGISKDYLIVGGGITREEAEAFCQELKSLLATGATTDAKGSEIKSEEKKESKYLNYSKSIEPEAPDVDYTFVNDVSQVNEENLKQWWSDLDFDWKWTFLHNLQFKNILEKDVKGYWFSKLVYYSIDKVPINDSLIERIQALEVVTLRPRHMNITHLEPLRKLGKLRALNCYGTYITDLSPISEACNLEILHTAYTKITSIEPIKNLSKLAELYLSYYEGSDYHVIANLGNLRIFECTKSSGFCDLSMLSDLHLLEELKFVHVPLYNLSPLHRLPNLRKLEVRNTDVEQKEFDKFIQAKPNCRLITFY